MCPCGVRRTRTPPESASRCHDRCPHGSSRGRRVPSTSGGNTNPPALGVPLRYPHSEMHAGLFGRVFKRQFPLCGDLGGAARQIERYRVGKMASNPNPASRTFIIKWGAGGHLAGAYTRRESPAPPPRRLPAPRSTESDQTLVYSENAGHPTTQRGGAMRHPWGAQRAGGGTCLEPIRAAKALPRPPGASLPPEQRFESKDCFLIFSIPIC